MEQLKLKELIDSLQKIYNEYGNLPVYETDDARTLEYCYLPKPKKIFYHTIPDFIHWDSPSVYLNYDDIDTPDEKLENVVLDKPVTIGVLL